MFTILRLLFLCGNWKYPDSFQNKSVGSSQVYSIPDPTEGRRKAFLKWTSVDLSSKRSLTCGGNDNYYKIVHHPIPTLPMGIGNTLAIFKTNQQALLSVKCPGIFSPWPNWRERKACFEVCKNRGGTSWHYLQEHLVVVRDEKVSPFVQFEIILPILCFLLDLLTSKHCRTWSSIINLWIDSRNCQK